MEAIGPTLLENPLILSGEPIYLGGKNNMLLNMINIP